MNLSGINGTWEKFVTSNQFINVDQMVMDHIRIDPFTYIVTLGGKFNEPLVSESFLALFLVCVMLSVAHNVLLYDNYYNEFEDAVKKKKNH
jgi:hypothetical protein